MNPRSFETKYRRYQSAVDRRLAAVVRGKTPALVYEPIRYILASGGKRLRAVLALLSCEAVGGNPAKAFDAAVAMEMLHNFTLIHDDVMDHADLRRGMPTVHRKWNQNVAILAGDELLGHAYRMLLKCDPKHLPAVTAVYTDALVTVCEGQALDADFENRPDVGVDDYFTMIQKKTGRVISAAAEIGAILGGAPPSRIRSLRSYGEHLGRAFQIRDDLLDIAGDTEEFGKRIGGDIVEGKKTFLLVHALTMARGSDRSLLRSIRPGNSAIRSRIGRIRSVYESCGAFAAARAEIERSTRQACQSLSVLPAERKAAMLGWLAGRLLDRNS